MITIIMFNEKWRIKIGDGRGMETFEFTNLDEMKKALDILLEMKKNYGRVNNER